MPIDRTTLNRCYEILAQAEKSSEQRLSLIHTIMRQAIPNLTLEQVIPELFSNTNTSLFDVKLSESSVAQDKENVEYEKLKELDDKIKSLERAKDTLESSIYSLKAKENNELEKLTLYSRFLKECYLIRNSEGADGDKSMRISRKIGEIKSVIEKAAAIKPKDQNYYYSLAVEYQNLKQDNERLQREYAASLAKSRKDFLGQLVEKFETTDDEKFKKEFQQLQGEFLDKLTKDFAMSLPKGEMGRAVQKMGLQHQGIIALRQEYLSRLQSLTQEISQEKDKATNTLLAQKIDELKGIYVTELKKRFSEIVGAAGDFPHKGLSQLEREVVEIERKKDEVTSEVGPQIAASMAKLNDNLSQAKALRQELTAGLEREDAIKKKEKDRQSAESIDLRKVALENFFKDDANFKYLDNQDKNGKIPILIILGFEKIYSKDFVLRILRNTKDVAKYRYYDRPLSSGSDTSVEEDRVSLGSSIRGADSSEGQSLLDYLVRQQAGEANSGEIAVEMLKMGIPLNFRFEPVEKGQPPKENMVLNKLLESRSLKWGLAKALCLYYLKEEHDLSLFFDLLRYEEARSGSISSVAGSYVATPRRSSLLGGSRSASFSHDASFSTSAASPYAIQDGSTSFDFAAQAATVPAMAEDEGTIDNFVYDVIDEILNDKSEEVAVDIIRSEKDITRKHENIASFLLRKFLFHEKQKNIPGSKRREAEGRFIQSIWTELQSDANLRRIPLKMLSVADRDGNTFLHHIASHVNSNVLSAVMYKVLLEAGQKKWEELISITNHAGETPLDLACAIGFDSGIQQFSMPELFPESFTGAAQDKDRELSPLAKVASKGTVDSCKILLRLGAANCEYSDVASTHPAALAIKNNNESLLESLLKYGFDPNQKVYVAGSTMDTSRHVSLLEYAKNNFKATILLIKYGAEIPQDFSLSFSDHVQKRDIERARADYLEQKDNIDEAIAQRKALCPLVYSQFIEARTHIVGMYKLGCGPDVIAKAKEIKEAIIKAKDQNRLAELMTELKNIPPPRVLALRAFLFEIYEKFQKPQGEPNHKIQDALVELMKNLDVTDIAIKRASEFFASLADLKDQEGKTFLHHLATFKDSELLRATVQQIIIERGITKWEEVAATKDQQQQIALHEACRVGFYDGMKDLIVDPSFFRAHNVDADVPLRMAIKQGDIQTCLSLLQLGASTSYPIFEHLDPLALVLKEDRNDILKLFLQYGFDPNRPIMLNRGTAEEPEYEKVSLLKYAIDNLKFDAVLLLIKYGADLEDEAYKKYKATHTTANKKELYDAELERQANGEARDEDVKTRQALSYERFKNFRAIKYYECGLKSHGFRGKKIAQLQDKILDSASIEEIREHQSQARLIPSLELSIMTELFGVIDKKLEHRLKRGSEELFERESKEFASLKTSLFNLDKEEGEKFKAIEKFFTNFVKKMEEDLRRAKTVGISVEKGADASVKAAKEAEKAAKLARMQVEIDILKAAKDLASGPRGHPENEPKMRTALNMIINITVPPLPPVVLTSPLRRGSASAAAAAMVGSPNSSFTTVGSQGSPLRPQPSRPSTDMERGEGSEHARRLAGAFAGRSIGDGDSEKTG